MKRIIVALLALVMLLQCGCAVAPQGAVTGKEVVKLNTENKISISVPACDVAYVRGGKYASMTYAEVGEATGTSTILVSKNDTGGGAEGGEVSRDNSRQFFVQFDFGKADVINYTTAKLSVNATSIVDDQFSVYMVDGPVDLQAITWNTRPMGELIESGYALRDFNPPNMMPYIEDAIKYNGGILTLRFVQEEKSGSEAKISSDVNMLFSMEENMGAYVYNIFPDEAENKALWEYAQTLYDEWYVRYEQVLADKANDPVIEKIESDESHYTMSVNSYAKTAQNQATPHATRTVAAMTDLSEYVNLNNKLEYDEYGGLVDNSLRRDATGSFYTQKIGDRWWLIDPLGYPCYMRGLSSVTMQYSPNSKQKPAALAKYGNEEKWAIAVTRRLKDDLGFNLTTGGSTELLEVESSLYRQIGIGGFAGLYGSQIGVNASVGGSTVFSENNTMPVFDPNFVTFSDERAKLQGEKYQGDKTILGFTTDNELPMQKTMLSDYLSVDPLKVIDGVYVNAYSYACAWTWLINMTGKDQPESSDVTDELKELFRGFVWDRYFFVVCNAVRKYDDEHMIIGTRFLTQVNKAEWVLRFAALYLDAITINWYGSWEPEAETLWNMCTYGDLPIIITEFYAKAKENEDNLAHTDTSAGWLVQTQNDRGYFYQNFTLRLLECKNVIGWYWFQYLDCDPTGTQSDKSSLDSNKGIMSNTHNEYTDLTSKMAEINNNVYHFIDYFDQKYAD